MGLGSRNTCLRRTAAQNTHKYVLRMREANPQLHVANMQAMNTKPSKTVHQTIETEVKKVLELIYALLRFQRFKNRRNRS